MCQANEKDNLTNLKDGSKGLRKNYLAGTVVVGLKVNIGSWQCRPTSTTVSTMQTAMF